MTAHYAAHGLTHDFHCWAVRIGSSNVGDMGLAGRSEIIEAIETRRDDILEFAKYLRDRKLPLRRYWPNGVYERPDFEIAEIDLAADSFEWEIFSIITVAAHEVDELSAELSRRSRPQ